MEFKLGGAVVAVSVGIERAPLRELTKPSPMLSTAEPPIESSDLATEQRARHWLAQEELRRERRRVELLGWWNGLYNSGR